MPEKLPSAETVTGKLSTRLGSQGRLSATAVLADDMGGGHCRERSGLGVK